MTPVSEENDRLYKGLDLTTESIAFNSVFDVEFILVLVRKSERKVS
jgi:hypothetical protein